MLENKIRIDKNNNEKIKRFMARKKNFKNVEK